MRTSTPDEDGFTRQVIRFAKLHSWYCTYFRTARTVGGWRTPVSGDVGFPDLVLVRERVVWAELKTSTGRLSPEQQAWIESLRAAGQEVYLWTHSD